jgi:hypothetical protein
LKRGEDSAFISEAADRVTPFGGPVKFKKFDTNEEGVLPLLFATEFKQYITSSPLIM